MSYCENIPLATSANIPTALMPQCDGGFVDARKTRRYTTVDWKKYVYLVAKEDSIITVLDQKPQNEDGIWELMS